MSRWVLVTGGARRIGRAIALEFAKAGWDVIVHYNSSHADAELLAHDIEKLGRSAALAEIDLANERLVKNLIPSLTEALGPLTALINNASLFEPDNMDQDGGRHWAVNFMAPKILGESFYEMCAADAAIVNLLDADPSIANFTSYSRSKKALADLTIETARRYAPKLRVNGIALGPTLPSPRQSQAHFDKLVKATKLGRAVTPEEIAKAVRALAENLAAHGSIMRAYDGLT